MGQIQSSRLWAAERVESGCRNISNCLSIGTKVDMCSKGLKEMAREKGWWDGREPFHWAEVLGGGACGELESPDSRWRCGKNLLEEGAREGGATPLGEESWVLATLGPLSMLPFLIKVKRD